MPRLYRQILNATLVQVDVPFRVAGKVLGVMDFVCQDEQGSHVIDWKSDVFNSVWACIKG